MQTKIFLLIALATVLFSNCTNVELIDPVVESSFEVTAIMEEVGQTRSNVNDKGYFTWAADDKISVFTTDGNKVSGKLVDGEGTPSAKFQYSITSADVEANGYAVYPHHSDHTLNAGSLTVTMPSVYYLGSNTANTNAIMLALPSDENVSEFKFQHLGAVIRFHFTNVPAGVDKFVLSLGDKKINGSFVVNTEDLTISTGETDTEVEKSVTLSFDPLEEVTDLTLYVPVPTGNYTGISASLNAGDVVKWSYDSKDASNDIKRRDLKLAVVTINSATGDIENDELAGEGTKASPYLISDLDDLIFFRDKVNEGDTKYNAEGVYVALADDIDMASVDWSVNIGDDCNATFDGIFDGKGHVIKNLNSTENASKKDGYFCTGLFGAIYGPAVIKNLTIDNVSINTGEYVGNNAAAVVGFAYGSTGSVENVNVTGDILINARNITGVGTVVGYAYGSKLTVYNCEVKGNDDSQITGAAYVGGVIGYSTTDNLYKNTVKNVDITATSCCTGGVAGIMLKGGVATGNTVESVSLVSTHQNWQNSAAVVAGSVTGKITAANTIFNNVTANGYATTSIVGSAHADKPTVPVAKVQARINDDYYVTFMDALSAVSEGQTVTLLSDVELAETLIVEKGEELTLDLNGCAVSQTKNCTGNYSMILNKGKFTVNDSSNGTGKISFKDSSEGDPSFGWGSYTIRNEGTLVIEDGKIEHLGEQNVTGQPAKHMICAIFQYNGSTIINGGTISTPHYRSVRLWSGDMTINGGEYDGQFWVQAVNNTAKLTIKGGTFSPNWNDGSSIFIGNVADNGSVYTVDLSVTGGNFSTKIGCNVEEAGVKGKVTGGIFTESAKTNTPGYLIGEGYGFVADANGAYTLVKAEN